ncbi:MAG: hypothetical protein HRU20_15275 [Pseudomonadales bacterium]|nr:hypothetical protein [Pseudomonadales bacterium]
MKIRILHLAFLTLFCGFLQASEGIDGVATIPYLTLHGLSYGEIDADILKIKKQHEWKAMIDLSLQNKLNYPLVPPLKFMNLQ